MGELLTAFHFSEPAWLWALLLYVPVAVWLLLFRRLAGNNDRIQRYADEHLLPHLLGRSTASTHTQWKRYARWAGLWTLLVLAMYHVVVGFFTMAPLYKDLNGIDLLAEPAVARQTRLLIGLSERLFTQPQPPR